MGREIKRVAADFNWPLNKVWPGFLNPHCKHSHQCPDCKNGYSPAAAHYFEEWYGNVDFDPVAYGSQLMTPEHPTLRAWVDYWNKSVEDHSGHYLPRWNGYTPTPDEVNSWSIGGFGHDGINSHTCIKARCEREGHPVECATCKGHARYWEPKEAEQWADDWKSEEPPAGDAYQIWETVSEGSPISPAFLDPRDLAEWMSNAPPWGASQKMSADKWFVWITGPGWSPSAITVNGVLKDGVEAMVEDLT